MPDTPPAMLPGTYVMDQATVDRLVTSAALAAARQVKDAGPSREDMEEIAGRAIEHFLDRVGIDDIPGFRKDLPAMRSAREIRESLIKNGLGAVLTLLIGGIGTAIWLAIKGVK